MRALNRTIEMLHIMMCGQSKYRELNIAIQTGACICPLLKQKKFTGVCSRCPGNAIEECTVCTVQQVHSQLALANANQE